MLDKTSFVTTLQNTVFNQTTWDTAAINLAIAINDYYQSGVTSISVAGTVIPPSPAPSYPAYGVGTGSPVTTSTGYLQSQCVSAFGKTTWDEVGPEIALGIDTLIISSTLSTTVAPATTIDPENPPPAPQVLVGTGSSTSIVTTGSTGLGVNLNIIFKQNNISWDIIASNLADEIDSFIKQVVFTTTDSGTTPSVSWSGGGTGYITQ